MSLLAALAKGFGAGTVNNARAGFAEQQRQREAAQRKEEVSTELSAAETRLQRNIDAGKADTETRLAAQSSENAKQREHDLALWERKYAAETQAAVANAGARARESHAKNIMGTMDQLAKRKTELMKDDKLTDDQRAVALGEIDALGYTLAADPGAQQLLGEFGGGGYASYWLSLAPQPAAKDSAPASHATQSPASPPPRKEGNQAAASGPGTGGVIGSIQQKASAGSFWDGREAERSLFDQLRRSAPAAAMTNNTKSPAAAEAYKAMYK
ncbi:hypothetical protein [Aeromonas molluscorum]|uniref:hypothetical protein n=1 Tax=Aeromonas molluscorum TaxID=271417 RepID=UPI003F1B32A5